MTVTPLFLFGTKCPHKCQSRRTMQGTFIFKNMNKNIGVRIGPGPRANHELCTSDFVSSITKGGRGTPDSSNIVKREESFES